MGLVTQAAYYLASGSMDLSKSVKGLTNIVMGTDIQRGKGPGEAAVTDPYVWSFASGLFVEKPQALSYTTLRFLAKKDPLLAAIILTRLRQVVSFASVRSHDETEKSVGKGFRVRLKQGADKKRTKAVEKVEEEHNQLLLTCARSDVPFNKRWNRHFAQFLWAFVRDRLAIDQASAELVLDRKGSLVQFHALDGATIRKVREDSSLHKDVKYVQVYNQRVIATFTEEQLAFCPENLSTDLSSFGYGESEAEYALKMIMTRLGIDESNARIFHPASIPSGMLVTKNTDMTQEQVDKLAMRWRAEVGGVRGQHRIPVFGLPRGGDVSFIKLPRAVEGEYGKLNDFIVNLVTALYGLDPAEINSPNRGGLGMSGGALSSANEEARLTQSKDKGLWPMLAWLERSINLEFMPIMDPTGDFEFAFVGRDLKSDGDRADLIVKQVKSYKLVNEVRVEQGLEERDDCDVILEGTWLQAKQAAEAQAQQGEDGVAESEESTEETGQADQDVDNGEGGESQERGSEGGTPWSKWQQEGDKGQGW